MPFPSPGDLPDPGVKPGSPVLWADALPSELPGKSNQKERVARCSQGKSRGQQRLHRGGSVFPLHEQKSIFEVRKVPPGSDLLHCCVGHSTADLAFSLALFYWLASTWTLKHWFGSLTCKIVHFKFVDFALEAEVLIVLCPSLNACITLVNNGTFLYYMCHLRPEGEYLCWYKLPA